MTFYGKIVAGELQIISSKKVAQEISNLEDGLVELTLKHKNQRSIQQNRYLHGLLIPEFRKALNSVGYDIKDDVQAKRIFKAMFLTRHVENHNKDGVLLEVPIVLDTSTLNKKEMNELYDEVIRFCAEHMNYQIPYPGEKMEMDF